MSTSAVSRRWVVVAILATMGNSVIGRWLQVGAWRPEVVMVALVYLGLTGGSVLAVIVGFLAGIYQDLYAPQVLGTHSLAYGVVGYLAALVGDTVRAERVWIQGISLFSLSLLSELVVGVTKGWAGLAEDLLSRMLLSALYTSLLGLLLAYIFGDWLLPKGWGVRDVSRWRRVR